MHILHLTWSLQLGGIETMLVNIANEQSKTESVTMVVINNLFDNELVNSISGRVRVIFLNRKAKSRSVIPFLKLYYYILRLSPDIIHVHSKDMNPFVRPFIKKTAYTVHDTGICLGSKEYFIHYYTISQSVKKDFDNRNGVISTVVYNGIKVSDIKNRVEERGMNEPFRIVQVSRLMHEKKGQHILVEAIALLKEKSVNNIFVDFIGEGASQNYLWSLVDKYGLEDHIHFLGAKPYAYVSRHLCDYDLLVQPSIYEGFGLTVAEGMAAKIPVLVSDIEGPMEIIDNGRYGYCFEKGNVKDCADMIEKIRNNTDEEMLDKAYNHVIETFTVELTASNYIKEYKKIVL